MTQTMSFLPRVAIFIGRFAARALPPSGPWQGGAGVNRLEAELARLENRMAADESANAERFQRIEARLEEHAARLAAVPSSEQINAAMEVLLSKTLRSLDSRLKVHAQSIDELKSTVSQTDSLLRKVLESFDSMQTGIDANQAAERRRTAEVLAIEHPQQRSRRRQA